MLVEGKSRVAAYEFRTHYSLTHPQALKCSSGQQIAAKHTHFSYTRVPRFDSSGLVLVLGMGWGDACGDGWVVI